MHEKCECGPKWFVCWPQQMMTLCSLEDRGLDVGEHTHNHTLLQQTQVAWWYTVVHYILYCITPSLKTHTHTHTHTHTRKKNIIHSFQASAEDYLTSQRLVLQLLPSLSHTQTGFNHQIAGRPLLPLSVSPTLIPLHWLHQAWSADAQMLTDTMCSRPQISSISLYRLYENKSGLHGRLIWPPALREECVVKFDTQKMWMKNYRGCEKEINQNRIIFKGIVWHFGQNSYFRFCWEFHWMTRLMPLSNVPIKYDFA